MKSTLFIALLFMLAGISKLAAGDFDTSIAAFGASLGWLGWYLEEKRIRSQQ